ncbi:MAG: SH3 domain-containing protein [Candidatus Omnitrophica bacterium]|nr:SH3 domain-containing protein [Candidatus Omnitrophota bacterium]
MQQRTSLPAPVSIPDTIREMKTAGFWIAKIENPDKVILDAKGIDELNTKIEKELNLIINPLKESLRYNGKRLKSDLQKEIENFSKQKLYTADGKLADETFYAPIKQNMNLSQMPDKFNVGYGFLAHYDNQRLIPTDELLTKEPGDLEFDELQNSSLDVGTPLVILHESKDGLWIYADAPSSSGWFKKERVAFCEPSELKDLLSEENFVVITSAKADIFLDESLTKYYDYVRMGAKFTFNETGNPRAFEITIPLRAKDGKFSAQKAYIKKQDANIGYLPYTARNIIEQAFKLLNSPYGWGGMDGEQDCSSYIQEIFMTVGITLPRNSSAQAKIGIPLVKAGSETEEKLKIIKQEAIPGATILQMKGHIVLYIGMHKNTPYVIHETHGYGQMSGSENISRVVNRVIVSDLSLGEGSKKGSLISRITNIRLVE